MLVTQFVRQTLGSFTYYFQTSYYPIITQLITYKLIIRYISNKLLCKFNIGNYIP